MHKKYLKYAAAFSIAAGLLAPTALVFADSASGTRNSTYKSEKNVQYKACLKANEEVRKTYRETVQANNKAYSEAVKTSRKTQNEAIKKAQDAYKATASTSMQTLKTALAAATTQEAKKAAREAYNASMKTARETRNAAIKVANEGFQNTQKSLLEKRKTDNAKALQVRDAALVKCTLTSASTTPATVRE